LPWAAVCYLTSAWRLRFSQVNRLEQVARARAPPLP
jgi:hypothetical protein